MSNHYIKVSAIGMLLIFFMNVSWGYTHNKYELLGYLLPDKSDESITVLDEYGHPIQQAKIYSQQNEEVGMTDQQGQVILASRLSGNQIIIKHPGYYPKIVKLGELSVVTLTPQHLENRDTIDVLHDKRSKNELLGAVDIVYSKQLSTTPTPLYLNALTGRLAGFYTQEVNGFRSARSAAITSLDLAGSLPTSATKYSSNLSDNSEINFQLRGQNPVTIIDGVQREIYSIDPENIESISVAKDALSAILLGQRSSRGVLQITTKKGAIGPPRISFTAQTGFQQAVKTPEPLQAYQFAYLYNEALSNSGRQPVYSQEDFAAFKDGSNPIMFPNVNWYEAVLREKNPISKYNLGVNGGTKNARYALSLSYLKQDGMFNSSDEFDYETNLTQNRYLINSSIDVDVTTDFTIGLQFFGRIQDGRQPGSGTQNILNSLYTTPNNAYPIFNTDGSYGGSSVYRTNLYQQATGSGYLLDNTRDLLANLDFNYNFDKLLPGLYAKGKVNVSASSSSLIDRSRQQPVFDARYNEQGEVVYFRYGNITDQPNSFATTSTANFFYVQGALGYDKEIQGGHQVKTKVFLDRQTSNYQFDLPSIYTNFAASGSYAFQDKYFGELALNYSGFNRFQPKSRYGLFYAVGLGWELTKENFLKEQTDWLDGLKIRATYGKTGNTNEGGLGYYSWRASYGQDGNNGYEFGSEYAYINSIVEKGLANVDATWEKGNKFNLGLDISLWNSMFKLTAEYYHDTYSDLLQQRGSTIELIGIGYPAENIGKNSYQGQELTLTYQNHWGNFNYFLSANASRMRTEVLYMNEVFQKYDWNRRTGMPVGQTFGYQADGLIQNQLEAQDAPLLGGNIVHPGDVRLVDINGDGVINIYDQTAIGNTKPIIFYGATLGFNFYGFDFNILLQGVKNRTYQQTDYSFGSNGESQGFTYLLDRWTPETSATARYPRLTLGADPTNTPYLNNSSFWTRSGEYIRIRNIDIGYSLPFALTKKIGLSALRIFANAQNLFTITPYDRLDPEINGNTNYPLQRVINFGVNIKL